MGNMKIYVRIIMNCDFLFAIFLLQDYEFDASLKYCVMGFNPKAAAAMPEIKDHYPQYIVTLDELASGNINGIKILHLSDFLLETAGQLC
ncbi:hypothetical protein C819_00657 [Lachnospiraceae bacterium 10-1]|nr:hypothetical protein C819_00657 [Lachnospiraceae bacterium 10-1]